MLEEPITWKLDALTREFAVPLDLDDPFAGQRRRDREMLFEELCSILDRIKGKRDLTYWQYIRLTEIVQEWNRTVDISTS